MNSATWIIKPAGPETSILQQELGIPPVIARILAGRGITTPEEGRRFLYSTPADLYDPMLFKDMGKAVERILKAVDNREKILIFGDYDVDGVLSVVMLLRALGALGADVDYFVPDRLSDGYGIKGYHAEVIREKGAGLVISVDCGIKDIEFTEKAGKLGIDLIITDHHMPGDTLPDCSAILDPVLESSGYPEKNLAGVGVTFKLIQALLTARGREADVQHYLKLVCIGTVADVVELKGENRIFVKYGMESLSKVGNNGLKSLLEACGLSGKKVSEGDLGFRVGPRINAAGRMGKTDLAVQLFLSKDQSETNSLVKQIEHLNSMRQKTEEKILNQATAKIIERGLADRYKCIILGSEEWHRGVIGIVASKLKDHFHRPVILFSYENGDAFGSGRSISGVPLIGLLDGCAGVFKSYGGHKYAVGCTLPRESLPELKTAMNKLADENITEEMLVRKVRVDAPLDFNDIDQGFLKAYDLLLPFGVGNPRPLFLAEKVEVTGEPRLMKGKHIKFWGKQGGRAIEVIGWDMAGAASELVQGRTVDLVFTISQNEFRGETRTNLIIEDYKA